MSVREVPVHGSVASVANSIAPVVTVSYGCEKERTGVASSTTVTNAATKHTGASSAVAKAITFDKCTDREKILQMLHAARKRETAATADIPRCGKFPRSKVCGCNIPCRKAMSQVTLDEVRPRLFIGPVQAAYLDRQHKDKVCSDLLTITRTHI